MCDYSLCGLPTRLAAEGEELVVHRFRTGSMGLAAPDDLRPKMNAGPGRRQNFWKRVRNFLEGVPNSPPVMAICIPPGARMVLRDIPDDLQRCWKIGAEEPVIFTQLSANVNTYRDAMCFRSGARILLQNFREGMRVEVLSLAEGPAVKEPEVAIPAF